MDMSMDMDISEALQIARQLKNHYKAFERIDKFIKQGAAVQTFLKEGLVQKAKLKQELMDLKEDKDKASKAFTSMRKGRTRQIETQTKKLLEEYSTHSDEINKEIEALETKREEVSLDTEKAEKEHGEKMEAMEKEREKAQGGLEEIERKIAQIRERLE